MPHILIVDDSPATRDALLEATRIAWHDSISALDTAASANAVRIAADLQIDTARNLAEACLFELASYQLILCRAALPDGNGVDLVPTAHPAALVPYDESPETMDVARAVRHGAAHFIDIKADLAQVLPVLLKELALPKIEAVSEDNPPSATLHGMVGRSPAMKALFDNLRKVAPTESTVLIQGESGTGKELVSQALHQMSQRHTAPIISLNCAAIPEALIESELFGHEQGAFSGASADRPGLVESAHGGTLFLDEIGELPAEAQARLLRVLQQGEVRRVGSVETRRVDVRLIAATHRDLRRLTKEGRFREDLYYRLNVVSLHLLPLRERLEDLDALTAWHLQRICLKLGRSVPGLSPQTLEAMRSYHWPGNIRELENALERAAILCESGLIETEHLAIEPIIASAPAQEPVAEGSSSSLEDYFVNFVREHEEHMTETELAAQLGISRKSLWERRQRLDIPRKKTKRRGRRQ